MEEKTVKKVKLSMQVILSLVVLGVLLTTLACAATAPATPAPAAPQAKPTPAPAPQVITLKGQSCYPGGPWGSVGQGFREYAKWIEQRTNGQVKMTVADPGAIVPVAEMFTALSKGVFDVWMDAYPGYYAGAFPEALIHAGLPFTWENQTQVWDAFYNYGLLEEYRKLYAANNIYLISSNGPNADNGFQATFPFTSVNEFKGKKIGASGGEGELMKILGASPVLIPYAERYMALKTGTIDGIVTGLTMLEDAKLKEMIKYVCFEPNVNCFGCGQLINMDVWKKLPPDIQKITLRWSPCPQKIEMRLGI